MGTFVPKMGTKRKSSKSPALFGKARSAVLGLLYGHPDESFYLRQIARAVGVGQGAVQRELKALEMTGLLRRTVRGRQVYFQANADSPVFPELERLIVKTTGIANVLRSALAPLADRVQVAFVYGSIARGEPLRASDVDVLIVGDVEFAEVVAALATAQKKVGREVNPSVYGRADFERKVSQRQHFLTALLGEPKIFLIGSQNELDAMAAVRLAR
jgi:predicted nucleotidyltransferase